MHHITKAMVESRKRGIRRFDEGGPAQAGHWENDTWVPDSATPEPQVLLPGYHAAGAQGTPLPGYTAVPNKTTGEISVVPSGLAKYLSMTPEDLKKLPYAEAQSVAFQLQNYGKGNNNTNPVGQTFAQLMQVQPQATHAAVSAQDAQSAANAAHNGNMPTGGLLGGIMNSNIPLSNGATFGQLGNATTTGNISGNGLNAIYALDPTIQAGRLTGIGSENDYQHMAGIANTVGQIWTGSAIGGAAAGAYNPGAVAGGTGAVGSGIAAGAVGGAAGGAAMGALTTAPGGSVGQNALTGAAVGGALGGALGYWNSTGKPAKPVDPSTTQYDPISGSWLDSSGNAYDAAGNPAAGYTSPADIQTNGIPNANASAQPTYDPVTGQWTTDGGTVAVDPATGNPIPAYNGPMTGVGTATTPPGPAPSGMKWEKVLTDPNTWKLVALVAGALASPASQPTPAGSGGIGSINPAPIASNWKPPVLDYQNQNWMANAINGSGTLQALRRKDVVAQQAAAQTAAAQPIQPPAAQVPFDATNGGGGAREGGLMHMARGGLLNLRPRTPPIGSQPRMVKGPGDGMSDDVPAYIDGAGKREHEPIRVANDEYIVPADVVSHLGNGSSDAGAKKLDKMASGIRAARTGKAKQAPQVNADKYLPTGRK
jgi:hypothetical protein